VILTTEGGTKVKMKMKNQGPDRGGDWVERSKEAYANPVSFFAVFMDQDHLSETDCSALCR
jgi:hypothetical protein